MANFPQHLAFGATTSAVAAVVGNLQFGLSPMEAGAACILGTLASLAPDLDHPEGIPAKILSDILVSLSPVFLFLCVQKRYLLEGLHLEHWIVIFCVAHLVVKYSSLFLLNWLTSHRGIFHSVPAVVLCGQIAFLVFPHLPIGRRSVVAAIAMLGYFVHLLADEIYGVDWDRMEAKKSLGSALDFGRLDSFSTWIAYLMISAFGLVICWQCVPAGHPVGVALRRIAGLILP